MGSDCNWEKVIRYWVANSLKMDHSSFDHEPTFQDGPRPTKGKLQIQNSIVSAQW
jgi:hypothetical protein